MACKQLDSYAHRLREAAAALRQGLPLPPDTADQLDHAAQALDAPLEAVRVDDANQDHQRLAAIVQSSQDAIITEDLQGRITSWNRGAQHIFGYNENEILGQSDTILLPAERVEELTWVLNRVRAHQPITPFETVRVDKDGRQINVFISISPLHDPHNHLIGISVIARDITEQIHAQQMIRESEERLELAMWGSQLGIWDRDVGTGQLVFNEQWANMLGYDRHEIQPHTSAWRKLIHPDDLPSVDAALRAHLNGEKPFYEVEHRLKTKSGDWRWVLSRGRITAWNPNGTPVRITGTHQDITERKQTEQALRESEQRFRELAAHTHEVFWMAKVDFSRILYISPAYHGIWGRSVQSLYQSPTLWLDTIHEDDRSTVSAALLDPPMETRATLKYRIRQPDGQIRWILNRATPIRDQQGQIYRIVGVAEDITDQHLAQTQAHQRQEHAAHIARLNMLGEMATGFAHELNQPLAAISNYAQGCLRWLEAERFDANQFTTALQHVLAQTQRAGLVIQRIRRLARKHEPERRPLDLHGLIREAAALADHELRHHDVQICLSLHDQPLIIQGDSVQLEQVILNLLRNAIEAIDDHPHATRRIHIQTQPDHQGHVQLLVRDHGPGMTNEQLDHMFHPFYTSKPNGMGMGLNICQSIMEAHGGRLEGRLNPDRGMTFVITLPTEPKEID